MAIASLELMSEVSIMRGVRNDKSCRMAIAHESHLPQDIMICEILKCEQPLPTMLHLRIPAVHEEYEIPIGTARVVTNAVTTYSCRLCHDQGPFSFCKD